MIKGRVWWKMILHCKIAKCCSCAFQLMGPMGHGSHIFLFLFIYVLNKMCVKWIFTYKDTFPGEKYEPKIPILTFILKHPVLKYVSRPLFGIFRQGNFLKIHSNRFLKHHVVGRYTYYIELYPGFKVVITFLLNLVNFYKKASSSQLCYIPVIFYIIYAVTQYYVHIITI